MLVAGAGVNGTPPPATVVIRYRCAWHRAGSAANAAAMRTEGLIIYSPAIILVLTGNLAALEGFQLLQRARPVLAEQARETPVRQHLAARLAARTIVGLIAGVANAQHFFATSRTGLAVAPMHGHPIAESGHLLREFLAGFGAQPVEPQRRSIARRGMQPRDLFRRQFARLRDGRQSRGMQDLVRIGIADAAERPRIGERPLQRVILESKRLAEHRQIRYENIDAAGIERAQPLLAPHHVQRRPTLAAGLGERKRAVREF